ncbi:MULTISPECIES: hypothetical protein [Nitrosomonas]|uniref:hypothetical protein n=1 Tax=Nitrosomonas TaxID=914 RepID=UPI00130E0100|nr:MULTISPECIES: hypothetical protein [Nitrosomonas]UVS61630.1 hypothetical protein NX761_00285 [Nitrosomonas sp. PLL12]
MQRFKISTTLFVRFQNSNKTAMMCHQAIRQNIVPPVLQHSLWINASTVIEEKIFLAA